MKPAFLFFDKGSILIRGEIRVPYATWDERVKAFRAQALYYREIFEYLKRSELDFKDYIQDLIPCPNLICNNIYLRSYQMRALRAWDEAGRRGVMVLPTGAGKTFIAMKAIEMVNQPSIIVVPTLDLVEQWRSRLKEEFRVEVGVYGGGDNILKALTVSTYDSAYLKAGEIGNRFSLIIFDEVHHLPAEGYRQISEMFTAPYRMGLTATYEREDMLHRELPRLTGGVVYRCETEDLAGRYLSEYTLHRMNVALTDEEKVEYEKNYNVFKDYLASRGIRLTTSVEFQKFVMRSARDRDARQALLARNRALNIAFNSEAKIKALEEILKSNPEDRSLIFTQHNELVYRISKRFLIPYITHTTDKGERHEILKGFKDGRFRAIVTSKVLDEGIDVPEASLGIIVSGTGSSREFVQRLGRLLRKRKGKKAKLIELVSKETSEMRTSWRRKRSRVAGDI
ncbi:MAG: DEAD/DEAH box helicase family protein [Candidatus Methylarchaceae archaeon HK02M1]|nr:DEAD/DEAH box helicase family protein [Candidatus Methylarchaceae archaeon HK02M1]